MIDLNVNWEIAVYVGLAVLVGIISFGKFLHNPRPPKEWWDKRRRQVEKQYPDRSERDISKITAGIWYNYKPSTRKRLLRKYG